MGIIAFFVVVEKNNFFRTSSTISVLPTTPFGIAWLLGIESSLEAIKN